MKARLATVPEHGHHVLLFAQGLGWAMRCSFCGEQRGMRSLRVSGNSRWLDAFLLDHCHAEPRARPGDAS